VKPLLKPKRNTLILHDLPEDVTDEELHVLFEALPDKESFCSVKPDVNRTAYATFRDDEAAQSAALWLRLQKLRDSSVKCAVKAEHFLKSFFPVTPGARHTGTMQYGAPGEVMWSMPAWWSHVGGIPYDESIDSGWGDSGCGDAGGWMSGAEDPNATPRTKGGKGKCFKGKGRRKGGGPLGFETDMVPMEAQRSIAERQSPSLQARLNPEATFPPLSQEQIPTPADVDVVDDDSLGYAYDFRKYTRQQIVEVCNAMSEVMRPESYARFESEEQDVQLFRQIPHKDWAPVPTPQITFAPSAFAAVAERRRSASVDMAGSSAVDLFSGSRPRKSSASGWSRRARSTSRGRQVNSAEADEWGGDGSAWEAGDWEYWGDERPWEAGEPPVGGARLRRSSATQRSCWNDRPGPQWVEKSKVREASQARESSQTRQQGEGSETTEAWSPAKPMSWVEKVRVAAEASGGLGGAPQRWEAKKSMRAAEGVRQEKAELTESDAAKEPVEASASAPEAAQDTGTGERSGEAPPGSEATAAIAEKATTAAQEQQAQTWAQRATSPKSQDQPQQPQQQPRQQPQQQPQQLQQLQQPQQPQPQQQQKQSREPKRAADEAAAVSQSAAAAAPPKRGQASEGDAGSKPSEAEEPRTQTWADRLRKGTSR